MSVALRGNLGDFGIADVFQLVGQQRKTGVLEVSGGGKVLRIAFDAGAIVWGWWGGQHGHEALSEMLVRCGLLTRERARVLSGQSLQSARPLHAVAVETGDVPADEMEEIVDLLTQEVLFEVIRWKRGSFHFSAQTVDHDRGPDRLIAAEQILMDGLRKIDEWDSFADQVPGENAIFARGGSFELYRQQARGEDRAGIERVERVFQLVDGRLSARRIIDLARLGTFDGTQMLAALRESGAIELVESGVPGRGERPVRRSAASALAGLRVALSATVPLALLASAFWMSANVIGLRPEPPGIAIEHRAFERAVAAFEARRIRNGLETHRYLFARWPERIVEVDRTGWNVSPSLAASRGGPYYYKRRGDEVLLLAPER